MENIATISLPNCPACGAEGVLWLDHVSDPLGNVPGEWSFRKCPAQECGRVWLAPAPLVSELWKAYAAYHTHTHDNSGKLGRSLLGFANRLARMMFFPVWASNGLLCEARRMKHMTMDELPPGKLLDVGCGGGRFMHRMARKGWEAEGIDFDEKATQKITRRYGLKTYTGDLLACRLPAASYDAITLSHAIEHVPDPAAVLTECLRLLKPGGRLVITTPNIEGIAAAMFGPHWRGWEPPRHLHLFSTSSLTKLLLKTGFEIAEVRTSAADAAGIYRVSKISQQQKNGKVSFLFCLSLIIWSYRMELAEFRAQQAGQNAGQNLLACASKPLPAN